jgi:hypothetical protein
MALGLEVPRHRVAHDAETEERDFRHGLILPWRVGAVLGTAAGPVKPDVAPSHGEGLTSKLKYLARIRS